jgi:excisionase family DNA binding protein
MSTEWLSVEDIANELSIPIDRVRYWIRQKKLRAYRVGREYRIKRVDYNQFLEERATTSDEKHNPDLEQEDF